MSTEQAKSTSANALEQYLSYPFETDEDYKRGLAYLNAQNSLISMSDLEKENIARKSRVFYFNHKTGNSLNVDEVIAYETAKAQPDAAPAVAKVTPAQAATVPASSTEGERILTFAELKQLIEQGKTDQIPNNRVIPNELSKEAPSESKTSVRKKPWET